MAISSLETCRQIALHWAEVEEVAATFTRAGVPCRISENITVELWEKLIMNCAYNAISALSRKKYGRSLKITGTMEVMKRVVIEAVAVGGRGRSAVVR